MEKNKNKDVEFWHEINSFTENLLLKNIVTEDGSEYFKKNSLNFRCDEFTTTHKEKHVLFSGCSNTYGVGLKKEETWPYKVYNKINKIEECSGYFNIAESGNSIYKIVLDIFKYCKTFGKPDIIFINLPDQYRFFDFNENKYVAIKYTNKNFFNFIKLLNYNIYFMLEEYCSSNNIQLFTFSWSYREKNRLTLNNFNLENDSTNEVFKEYNLKSFYYIDIKEMYNQLFLLQESSKIPDIVSYNRSRDDSHFGIGYHVFWSDFIFNKYLNNQ